MFNTIKSKIIIAGILAVAIPVIFILTLVNKEKSNVSNTVVKESSKQLNEHIQSIVRGAYALCESQQELLSKVLQSNMNVLSDVIKARGGLSLGAENVEWKAVNQFNQKESIISLPKMNYGKGFLEQGGGKWLEPNYERNMPTPIIDDTANLVGDTCTIFQRMNESGDMLRVATNVITKDGKRAIGTYIPAFDDAGVKNAVIDSVLSSRPYIGRAFVVNAWYATIYTPLKDETGKIIGMIYVGVKQESVESLRKAIMDIKIGKSGHVFVLGGSGTHLGNYIISPRGESDGRQRRFRAPGNERNDRSVQKIGRGAYRLRVLLEEQRRKRAAPESGFGFIFRKVGLDHIRQCLSRRIYSDDRHSQRRHR